MAETKAQLQQHIERLHKQVLALKIRFADLKERKSCGAIRERCALQQIENYALMNPDSTMAESLEYLQGLINHGMGDNGLQLDGRCNNGGPRTYKVRISG